MSDPRCARLWVVSRLSRCAWTLLLCRLSPWTTAQETRAPTIVDALPSHVFQRHQVQQFSMKAKWIP